jgi:co-chaperonin GroES (HSP10)
MTEEPEELLTAAEILKESCEEPFFLEPIGRRMIVKPDKFEYKGRLVIPDKLKVKSTTGTILVLGEPHETLKVGDRVLYDMFSGSELGFQGENGEPDLHVRCLGFDEVMCIVHSNAVLKPIQ